ncbi:MAG: SUMF1/EgtB/PvdO family nonheme iron enzyme [Candidatus Hydrogenedentes bacterium]|nr:SUMF1/EgtB/PvdO family nonheme iron enzyme [Candidatus Hydrogenedentota bacterium]
MCIRCRTPLPQVKLKSEIQPPLDPAANRAVTLRRGQVFANRYTVLDLLGRGGMGCIYRVKDNTLGEEVALKTLLPQFVQDKIVVERFLNEARIARQLSHPNIVRVHDIGVAGDTLYISMEYLKGKSLRTILEGLMPGQRLPIRTTLQLFDQLCAALEYAHQFTVHRDLKPENVMVAEDGNVRLMDFGISKLMSNPQLTATSMVMGTPYYMSPEQIRDSSRVDARADLYSLGVMLYEILTGNMPTGVPRPASQIMSEIPPALDPIVAKCLDPDPANRFRTATELRSAIRPILELVQTGSELRLPTGDSEKKFPRTGVRKAIGVLLALAIVGLDVIAVWRLEERRRAKVAAALQTALLSSPGAPSAANSDSLDNFEALTTRIRVAQIAVKSLGRTDEIWRADVDHAEQAWALAEEQASSDDARAVPRAQQALMLYLGLLLDMAYVPQGKVELLDPINGTGGEVLLHGFFMDLKEVTNRQFYEFYQDKNTQRLAAPFIDLNQPDRPVTNVTFYDAQAYAASVGKKLPTEAQWARAAYNPDGTPLAYPWGNEWKPDGCNSGDPEDGVDSLANVGSFAEDRTPSGCFDMAGNVMEWTRSRSAGLPYYPDDGRENQAQFTFGTKLIVRGGHFEDQNRATLAARYELPYEYQSPTLGFRCVKDLPNTLAAVDALLAQLRR